MLDISEGTRKMDSLFAKGMFETIVDFLRFLFDWIMVSLGLFFLFGGIKYLIEKPGDSEFSVLFLCGLGVIIICRFAPKRTKTNN